MRQSAEKYFAMQVTNPIEIDRERDTLTCSTSPPCLNRRLIKAPISGYSSHANRVGAVASPSFRSVPNPGLPRSLKGEKSKASSTSYCMIRIAICLVLHELLTWKAIPMFRPYAYATSFSSSSTGLPLVVAPPSTTLARADFAIRLAVLK